MRSTCCCDQEHWEQVLSGETEGSWSVEGTNTFGTLLAYLQAYRQWVSERKTADRTPYIRCEEDFPHYAKDTVLVFPFKHTQLWADVEPAVMATYSDVIEKICTQLAQADLPAIRNGIDHKRDEEGFPSPDKMIACASRLQQVIDVVDSKRLIPKLFWGETIESDSHGNICYTYTDYRGTTVSLRDPRPMVAGVKKAFAIPQLIAPFDFLGQPNSVMVFNVRARSEYADYWMDYPKRRYIPPKSTSGSRIDGDGTDEQPDTCDSQLSPPKHTHDPVRPFLPTTCGWLHYPNHCFSLLCSRGHASRLKNQSRPMAHISQKPMCPGNDLRQHLHTVQPKNHQADSILVVWG